MIVVMMVMTKMETAAIGGVKSKQAIFVAESRLRAVIRARLPA